jgi:hypothetical protein
VASLKELSGAIARSSRLNRPGRSPAGQGLCTHVNGSMARVSPYELGNVAAFVYEAARAHQASGRVHSRSVPASPRGRVVAQTRRKDSLSGPPRWRTIVHPRGSRHAIEDVWPGCVYAWLCTLATVEGLARGRTCWAAGQIGNRPAPVNGCPQRIPDRGKVARPQRYRPFVPSRPTVGVRPTPMGSRGNRKSLSSMFATFRDLATRAPCQAALRRLRCLPLEVTWDLATWRSS